MAEASRKGQRNYCRQLGSEVFSRMSDAANACRTFLQPVLDGGGNLNNLLYSLFSLDLKCGKFDE